MLSECDTILRVQRKPLKGGPKSAVFNAQIHHQTILFKIYVYRKKKRTQGFKISWGSSLLDEYSRRYSVEHGVVVGGIVIKYETSGGYFGKYEALEG